VATLPVKRERSRLVRCEVEMLAQQRSNYLLQLNLLPIPA
jgi:hypothetical protein